MWTKMSQKPQFDIYVSWLMSILIVFIEISLHVINIREAHHVIQLISIQLHHDGVFLSLFVWLPGNWDRIRIFRRQKHVISEIKPICLMEFIYFVISYFLCTSVWPLASCSAPLRIDRKSNVIEFPSFPLFASLLHFSTSLESQTQSSIPIATVDALPQRKLIASIRVCLSFADEIAQIN